MMNQRVFFKWQVLLMAICTLIWSACSDDDDKTEPVLPSLGLSEGSASFESEAGKYAVGVFSTGDWSASKEGDWITLDKSSGTGNGVIVLSFAANTGAEKRDGLITVKANGLADQKITFSQKGFELILRVLGENAYELRPEGGVMSLEVEANVDYKYELTEWVTVAPTTLSVTKSVISLAIAPNHSLLDRKADVIIRNAKTNAEVKKISLVQKGASLAIDETVNAAALGERLLIPVISTTDWDVKDPFDGAIEGRWLTAKKGEGTEAGMLVVDVLKSMSFSNRNVVIPVHIGLGEGNTKHIEIVQAARVVMSSSIKSIVTFNCDGDEVGKEYTVTADAAWSVVQAEGDKEWLEITKTENGFRLVCEKNPGETRTTSVVLTMDDESGSVPFQVIQEKYSDPLVLSKTSPWIVPSDALVDGLITATTMRGDRLEVTHDSEWLTVALDGLSTIVVNAAENTTGADLTAVLTVNLIRGEEVVATIPLTIIQEKKPAEAASITLSQSAYNFTFGREESLSMTVTSNVEWEASKDEENNDVTFEPMTGAAGTSTLVIKYNGGTRGPLPSGGITISVYPKGNMSDASKKTIVVKTPMN